VLKVRHLIASVAAVLACSAGSTSSTAGFNSSLSPKAPLADERGRELQKAIQALEYPYCKITIMEATGKSRGYVTADGCSLFYNPSQGGAPRLEELLREVLAVRRENIARDPERYARPRE